MKILSIECSASPSSAAILDNGKVIASGFINTKITHSQTLLPLIKSVLDTTNTDISRIDAFAVAAGPGSFTGIRIGISAVKGLAEAENKPCYPVSTLRAMAENVSEEDVIICAAMDARCNQFYNAFFTLQNGSVLRLSEDNALMFEELLESLSAYDKAGKRIVTVGDGAELLVKKALEAGINLTLLRERDRFQNAVSVGLAAFNDKEQIKPISPDELVPFYLRLPQAERELKRKQEEQK